ncbi:3-oxoacyl-[acyl-carrier protein] reductase [Actinomycetospora succinea]|uniref:3-oxoacyl-[acyl-carrier protein] reductase n=1 Tax=Actinomycetospora succinea TaxID=663603 RepID=A0A4R6VRF8_9PSEU|nr:SDR family oxidoreductase [Actinomycetospora succinea]TDQ65157.1 3-oxoacyl-[acyl-carrier protein] reductase [Actinomycetospora succinea]
MSDQVCLITGSSRGIGAASARELAARGHGVVVNHRDSATDAEAVAQEVRAAGGAALVVQGDVTDPGDVARMVDAVVGQWGRLDVLVHNAMTPFPVTSFADLSWEQLGTKLDQEMRAAHLLTHAVLPGMIDRGYGRLVYLSTGLSRRPRNGMIALGVAKAALDSFVRYVAAEVAPHGITANIVAPSTVEDTAVSERLPEELRAQLAAATPMRRLARPEDVARTVAYFASDDAAFTTGSWAPVNGGLIMP